MTTGTSTGVTADPAGPARPPVRFNPFSADFRADPYPIYQRLREERPVHKTLGMWVITRHADVRTVLRDRTFSAGLIPQLISRQAERVSRVDVGRIRRLGAKSLVFTDNPDHTRLRGLVNRVFTAPEIAQLRPRIARIAEDLIEGAWAAGGMDAITDFAGALPVRVMGDWMNLPDELRGRVGPWTHDIRFLLEPGLMKGDDFTHVAQVFDEFVAALDEVVAERRSRPGDDLISRLIAARTGGGDRFTDEELVFLGIMCFVAGNETTRALIGNGLLALLQNPAQGALLRRRPELLAGAVDEVLRYDSPLQMTKRLATREVELDGKSIRPGDQILLALGAANRDPAVFGAPDTFDIARDAGAHLAFGHGMHGCLGALLARMQAEVAFGGLFARPEQLELEAGPPDWQDHSLIVRGLRHLPVTIRAGR